MHLLPTTNTQAIQLPSIARYLIYSPSTQKAYIELKTSRRVSKLYRFFAIASVEAQAMNDRDENRADLLQQKDAIEIGDFSLGSQGRRTDLMVVSENGSK